MRRIIFSSCIAWVQERHPREQGLKPIGDKPVAPKYGVQERHPREQGLKLTVPSSRPDRCPGSRATSTRTRIETTMTVERAYEPIPRSRATSTRTRIETNHVEPDTKDYFMVQERHPREQGLKPVISPVVIYTVRYILYL